MESAGRAAALVLQRLYPSGRVVGAIGSGNNGGDAIVLLRTLASWGRDVAWVQAGSSLPDQALFHGHRIPPSEPSEPLFSSAAVLVDGILGTGASGEPREPAAGLIRAMNRSGAPIFALDQPSGADPTTGAVPGVVSRAEVTVCFGWPKLGLLFPPARREVGRMIAVEIGFPPGEEGEWYGAQLLSPAWAESALPARVFGAHKGTAGRLLVVAGAEGMAGAAGISGVSASRAGAGLVHLVSSAVNRDVLQQLAPEAIFTAADDREGVSRAVEKADALVAGPGLGTGSAAREVLDAVLDASKQLPTLLDADALNLLAREEGALERLASDRPLLVTPHPGEFARLIGGEISSVQERPLEHARSLAQRTRAVVLLKGAPSMVAARGEPVLVDSTGTSDLASAGMGDHLSGVAGAFLAAGLSPRDAAGAALVYSGRAARRAGRGRSLSPLDVAEHLAGAFADPGPRESTLGLPFVLFDQPSPW